MLLLEDLTHALDVVAFAEDALGFTLDPWQRDALRSGSRRLLLNCSRQSGKTIVAAIRALHRATFTVAKVVVVSPSERQSKEFYRLTRELADRLPTPPRMIEDNATACTLANGSRLISLPSSEATIRGLAGVDELIFDEASRVQDVMFTATRPMVSASRGSIVALSTPAGKRGWWYSAWADGGDRWDRVEIPATRSPRISAVELAEAQEDLPPWEFEQEFMCVFGDTIDSVFRSDDIFAAIDTTITPLFGATRVAEIHARA